jgi:hypothetical protein
MVNQIRLLRRAGVPLNIYTIRGLMIGHIEHHAPALLLVKLADGSTFSCSDLYVRKFLKRQMNFVPRTSTRAAQKVPANAAEVLWQSFLRLVYACWKRKVMHPQLRINFDQTQVVVQTQGGSTFEEEGAKQVAVVGKEEKRAWTAVVAVAASGDVLPLQIVMKGSDPKRSLPKATAPMMDEANTRKFDWALGGHTYWSNLETMKTYFVKIVVVWFDKWKTKLGLPSDQTCIVQLDVWSVHRSAAFLTWVNDNYPWIELHFVPGGCTGLFQPCDVGIQRPFKQAIKRAQLADIVNSTIEHLRVNEDPAALELDVTIGKLRSQCPRWFVQAFDAIQSPELVRNAFKACVVPGLPQYNLSHESITSAEAIGALLEIQEKEPDFWSELQKPRNNVAASDDGSNIPDSPFEDTLDNVDDSTDHPATIVEALLNPSKSGRNSNAAPGAMADDLDADVADVVVPALPPAVPARGAGKRVVKPNTLYSMDKFDRTPDDGVSEKKVTRRRRRGPAGTG